ncbi:tRNA1(Val) A37 N6-methylase TrmN6 [Paracoccus aminovorans]|uniref:tRNA1(Val) A37 N6-methylase TrmN6 n=1 Tax=Paracoccus aminovorans TaxID=34004 RepID=A0A1I3BAN2_9RHOB|nr:methyltransferase [Paracoccus aminovorans]CQR85363.1 methyltransferase [Paracoccus aminovorans]SFH59230.1 tRNA1(Val) A37 N6-methylase TrmN6 [Paracoccus aminovorans]
MNDTREDGFLGCRLTIAQPVRGYRAGADAVMLAAACPARPGESALELGCGAGVALICLGARVPGLRLAGLELQPGYAALARRNVAANGVDADILEGDLARMPAALRDRSFDHVIANPPYFRGGSVAPDPGRGTARHEATPLAGWIAAGLRRLRPGGWLTMIQRAERLGEMLAALTPSAGAITILPVAARTGAEAGRVILTARKGSRSPMRLLSPFVMHAKPSHSGHGEDLTGPADAVLRQGAALNLRDR